MPTTYTEFTPSDAAIVLVDHQPGVLAFIKSFPIPQLSANAGTLAKLGAEMGIPLLVTSTREDLEFLGTTIEDIQKAAPDAYQNRVRRHGTLNAFEDESFVAAVSALGRQNLIIAGATTDVCLWHTTLSALDAGYAVHVAADASGSTSELADHVTYEKMRELGISVGTTWGTLFELYPNVTTPEGQRAEAVAANALVAV